MTATELLIAALATWQIVEIWRHSELFAGRRAWIETKSGFFARLLMCPWCLSVWVALLTSLVTCIHPVSPPVFCCVCIAAKLVVYSFAVSRLANLGNDIFHDKCRTPKPDVLPLTSPETPSDTDSTA